jgi:SEC-C motif
MPQRPNQRMQDGYKRPLLCRDCEQRFSAFESATARLVFRPIVDNHTSAARYDDSFFRFLVSVLWRNLAIDIDDGFSPTEPEFHKVEEAWRLFLLEQRPLTVYSRVHVFIAGIPSSGPPGCSLYLSRDADFTVVKRASLPIAVFAKFAMFLIWAEVAPADHPEQWVNTLVVDGPGVLCSATQNISDGHFGALIVERAQMFRAKREQVQSAISPNQRESIMKWVWCNADHVARSEMMEAILADAASLSTPLPKVGRNERCPCGSGAKFRRCHGAR